MNIKIQWQNNEGKWVDFDLRDINHMPRNHALNLFQMGIPVIAKEGDTYLTNKPDIAKQYRNQKKPIKLFSECEKSGRRFEDVGFLQ